MITLGTVKFDFLTNDEPFAGWLNGRWESFFAATFEKVADEVLSAYDIPGRVITIDSLPLDLGTVPMDDFDRYFANQLRVALKEYMSRWTDADTSVALQAGVRLETVGQAALDLLCFYLLHGYLPSTASAEYADLHFLLAKVIGDSAYRFREFLECYGHYDFLCQRLIFSFADDELEEIVRVVQPSESKFVNLYVRVQLRSYPALKRPGITQNDYRNVIWTLVLAYLFSESRSRFSRKQVMMHTLRGIAAHFNFKFAEMARLMTDGVQRLEQSVGQLPELWSLLKEIRRDVRTELYALDGDYRRHLLLEILHAVQTEGMRDAVFTLSCEHLRYVLSDPSTCRELLACLREPHIHRLVGIIVPAEKEYIIGYSRFLDKNKDTGTFTGKAGNDFRLLKWEFIFAVLLSLPASAFNRRGFVLSVVQRLAAHYNLKVSELIRLLASEDEWRGTYLSPELLSVLRALDSELNGEVVETYLLDELSVEACEALLQTPLLVRQFVSMHTRRQMIAMVFRLVPAHGEFVVSYAALLDKGHDAGMLQGKAGREFRTLKWEFIFSCLLMDKGVAFDQKKFVYFVLQQLAAHYNGEVVELIRFFLQEFAAVWTELPFVRLKSVLQELYKEVAAPLDRANNNSPLQVNHGVVSQSCRGELLSAHPEQLKMVDDKELKQWILTLFGVGTPVQLGGRESHLEKWLTHFLNEQREVFRFLWRAGRLNIPFVLMLAGRTPALRSLWLHRIGDERLLTLYHHWQAVYKVLSSRFREYGFLEPAGEYLTVWMVELTSRTYSAWSETEIIRFLTARLRRTIPPGLEPLLDKIQPQMGKKLTEIIQYIDELKKEETMTNFREVGERIEVHNAGIVLLHPYLPMLFHRLGYLSEDRRSFKDTDSQIRAIFVLQYLVYGDQREYPETELYLNKVLVNMTDNVQPLPRKIELTREEIEWADKLIEGARQSWEKMRNTSTKAFRVSFLERKGYVSHTERVWNVRVEEKAFDVLLDSVPWGFKMFMASWLKDRIEVQWR